MIDTLRDFYKRETAVGTLLVFGTLLAILMANSPLSDFYDLLLSVPVTISVGTLGIDKPILLWINDGLMALFFLMIGLEIKREFLEGELATPSQIVLPAVAALGGMVVPALFYIAFNFNDPVGILGWAIPVATDIAFSLGILAMLGSRVPTSIKIFLMALAIIDDLGAIIVIALFYTTELSAISIIMASLCLALLILFNRMGVKRITHYLIVGIIMWACVLKSGVHATLAGVVLAFTVPLHTKNENEPSPLVELEEGLHNSVNFWILPLFAFANAGVVLSGEAIGNLTQSIPMGIILGLFVGKPLGVFSFTWIAVKLGFATIPTDAKWKHIYGVAVLCGIGFTMSLFIGSLAFDVVHEQALTVGRTAILVGSVLSAVVGYFLLKSAGSGNEI